MCGAPVLVIKRNQVLGIISECFKPIDYKDEATDLALPVKSMTNLYYVLQGKNAGLTVLSRFLQATSEEVESSFYKGIDEVYAPTVEYKVIKGSLRSKRNVFMTGTKELGKTFTTIKLMCGYFKEGNNSNKSYNLKKWVSARKEQEREGADPQELMKLIEKGRLYIEPHEIVYFKTLVGKTEYESSSISRTALEA